MLSSRSYDKLRKGKSPRVAENLDNKKKDWLWNSVQHWWLGNFPYLPRSKLMI